MSPQHRGLTVMGKKGPRWTGEVRFVAERLAEPLSWRKPRRVFVNSMSDLFHEGLDFDDIASIFGVMAACPKHTFQVLTKRPERAHDFMRWIVEQDRAIEDLDGCTPGLLHANAAALAAEVRRGGPQVLHMERCADPSGPWPLPNVWLGVSVEDQRTADERIPVLLDTPAALRWVSYEPALGPVDFTSLDVVRQGPVDALHPHDAIIRLDALRGHVRGPDEMLDARLEWIVVGGESGPGARPFDLAWARSTIAQGRAAGVPVFVKQLGARPYSSDDRDTCNGQLRYQIADRKGGEPSEWPADLRVREMPACRADAAKDAP